MEMQQRREREAMDVDDGCKRRSKWEFRVAVNGKGEGSRGGTYGGRRARKRTARREYESKSNCSAYPKQSSHINTSSLINAIFIFLFCPYLFSF